MFLKKQLNTLAGTREQPKIRGCGNENEYSRDLLLVLVRGPKTNFRGHLSYSHMVVFPAMISNRSVFVVAGCNLKEENSTEGRGTIDSLGVFSARNAISAWRSSTRKK